jgi:hypothetical protein
LWWWQTAGLSLDRRVVFDRLVIEEFIAQGCPALTPASAGNQRSKLLRMAEALNPSAANRARFAPLPPADPVRPYSASELAGLRSWATGGRPRRPDAGTPPPSSPSGPDTAQYLLTTLLVVSANLRKLRNFLAEAEAAADGTIKRLISRRTRRQDRLTDYAPDATGDPSAA